MERKDSAEKTARGTRTKTRRRFATEEKIRIVIEGLRGEESITSLCRREGIAANLYYRWSKARGRPYHPMTQGKIVHNHRSIKNVVQENYDSSWELERAIARFAEHYNHEWVHEAIGNVTPDDMYRGRQREILNRRAKTKRLTLERRKRENQCNAA